MIERGSGRTSGLTDWRLMDVLSMWACVQDQDTAGQWKQVAGWRKVCDLALAHLSRLREYRRGLAEAWPPETNAAARAYIVELDQLIDRVQRTHDAAAANYDALAAAARAIGSARAELQPLHEEYAKKLRQRQAYEATIADPKAVAGSRLPERPPVTDDDLEQLNVRARGLMTGLSGELQHAQVMLRQPPPPVRPSRDVAAEEIGGSGAVPLIPSVVPVATSPSTRSAKAVGRSERRLPPAAVPKHGPVIGPVLGGVSSGAAGTISQPVAPANITHPASANLGTTPVLPPNLPPGSSSPRSERPFASPQNSEGQRSGSATAPRTTPPGLIGGTPVVGQGQSNRSAPRKINPVGGVIGGGGAGTSPTGAAGSRPGGARASSTFAVPAGGNAAGGPMGYQPTTSRGRADQTKESTWDPDNPWETQKGVEPVMRPPEDEGPIDPGPAIGFNR
ncbi:hypothetical protein [Micromonospora aurantiaca (nom. illeg.)]|uniref:hypothetical protein n=1 Tax=Micromonospora aurantiaca (nom. illeg.) TaxID=47850 RepID=UPI0033C58FA7